MCLWFNLLFFQYSRIVYSQLKFKSPFQGICVRSIYSVRFVPKVFHVFGDLKVIRVLISQNTLIFRYWFDILISHLLVIFKFYILSHLQALESEYHSLKLSALIITCVALDKLYTFLASLSGNNCGTCLTRLENYMG